MTVRILAFAFAAVLASAQTLGAAPITYELTGLATGSLGGTDFLRAQFHLTGIGDTDNAVIVDPDVVRTPLSLFTFTLDGFATATISAPFNTFTNNLNNQGDSVAGFGRAGDQDFVNFEAAAFATYDNVSALGPIDVDLYFLLNLVGTDLGDLSFDTFADLVYTVTVGTEVPEPAPLALLGLGLAALAFCRRVIPRF